MVDPIFQNPNYHLARRLLDGAVLRQEAISTNVANAETPGYRRVDLNTDFAAQLRTQIASGGATPTNRPPLPLPRIVEDTSARSVRPDGNSVEIERELLALNRNAVEFNFLTEIVSSNLKQLKTAITGRVI